MKVHYWLIMNFFFLGIVDSIASQPGTVVITNMGAFNGTYQYSFDNPTPEPPYDYGWGASSLKTYTRLETATPEGGNSTYLRFAFPPEGGVKVQSIWVADPVESWMPAHFVYFNTNGEVHSNPPMAIVGDGTLVGGTLNNFAISWDGGGGGPGYVPPAGSPPYTPTFSIEIQDLASTVVRGLILQTGEFHPLEK